jgi:hypothetical protein
VQGYIVLPSSICCLDPSDGALFSAIEEGPINPVIYIQEIDGLDNGTAASLVVYVVRSVHLRH